MRKTAKELLELLKRDMEAAEWERVVTTMDRDEPTGKEGVDPTDDLRRTPLSSGFAAGVAAEFAAPRGLVASARITMDAPISSVWWALVNPDDEAKEHSQRNWESMLQGLKQLLEATGTDV